MSRTRRTAQTIFGAGYPEQDLRGKHHLDRAAGFDGLLRIGVARPGELVAAGRTVEDVAKIIGADSLAYQSLEGLLASVKAPGTYCTSCWTCKYPVPPEDEMDKMALEKRL